MKNEKLDKRFKKKLKIKKKMRKDVTYALVILNMLIFFLALQPQTSAFLDRYRKLEDIAVNQAQARENKVQIITQKLSKIDSKPQKSNDPCLNYNYNENVPESCILQEIEVLSERFQLNKDKWEQLVRCEATCNEYNFKRHDCVKGEIDNRAENPKSTAVGVGQYLIRTWNATESWKQLSKSRTDYKAALWEMALDLSNGEQNKWQECLDITGLRNFRQ